MNQTPFRVMLVDDEKDIVYVLRRGLELHGSLVDSFTDPVQALEQFVPGLYDAVITDIRMPQITGIELFVKIREADATVMVYFVSAYDSYEEEIRSKFSSDGMVGFVKKPTSYTRSEEHTSELQSPWHLV